MRPKRFTLILDEAELGQVTYALRTYRHLQTKRHSERHPADQQAIIASLDELIKKVEATRGNPIK